ncbi:MAG TPA: hypothetical protein VIE87_04240 [Pseudolabrys sp.]|jgi:hypothetical protein
MLAEAGIALLKLLLGLGVFAVLGYIGKRHDKRIAGVLLTFPILNGIGILTDNDPLAVADSIYAVVVFNGLLLFLMAWLCNALPPRDASPNVKLVARLIVWTAIWAIGAPLVIVWRDHLPGVLGLFLIQCCIAATTIVLFWKPDPQDLNAASDPVPPSPRHVRALIAFWSDRSGVSRLALFAVSFGILLFAAYVYEAKWVGMLSALPVPGLFAVATLSVIEKKEYFERMRDTVLLGPFSVIVFNWLYVQAVIRLPAAPFERTAFGIIAMLLLLLLDAIFIFWSTPLLARLFSRAFAARRER